MQHGVEHGVYPGAVLLVAHKGALLFSEAFGFAGLSPKRAMTADTVFDLASLTKPLATATSLMVLVQRGEVALDDTLGNILSDFAYTDKNNITIDQLLAHASGLPDYRPYFEKLRDLPAAVAKEDLRKRVLAEPLVYRPGQVCLYSDLGFMILQWVVETAGKASLDQFVQETVFDPLELKRLFFIPVTDTRVGRDGPFAATEDCPWRHKILEGEVHDDHAYVVGGVAGHAGLFGAAPDVFRLLQHLLETYAGRTVSGVFEQATVQTFFDRRFDAGSWSLGFDTPTRPDSSSGRYFSNHSVGHLGFTGTSFWMDLDRQVVVILLTNRVHPTRANDKIKAFRPLLHNTVMEAIVWAS